MISAICESFHCTPDVALNQDWGLVQRIMEYRMLSAGRKYKDEDINDWPESLIPIWREMLNG